MAIVKKHRNTNSASYSLRVTLLFFLFFLFQFFKAQAQDFGYRFRPPGITDTHIGIHGLAGFNGLAFSDIAPLPGPGAINKLSSNFDGGIYFESKLNLNFYYSLELNLATRPGKINFSDGSFTWTQYNVEVPVLLKYNLLNDFYAYGGFDFGRLVKTSIRRIENAPLPFLDSTTNLIPYSAAVNVSFILGGNYTLNDDFDLEFRLLHGISSLSNATNPFKGDHFLSVEFGIRFNLPTGNKSSEYLRY